MHVGRSRQLDADCAFQQAVRPQQSATAVAQPACDVAAEGQAGHERAEDCGDGEGGVAEDEAQEAGEGAFEDQAGRAGQGEAGQDDAGQPGAVAIRVYGGFQ